MKEYEIEIREAFKKKYLKVFLKNNLLLDEVKEYLDRLDNIKNINITENKRADLTIYPTRFINCTELEKEIIQTLDIFFQKVSSETTKAVKIAIDPSPQQTKQSQKNLKEIPTDPKSIKEEPIKKLNKKEKPVDISSSLKFLIPFSVMLLGVFFFTPIRNILLGESNAKINHNEKTEKGDIVQGDKNIYNGDSENELQSSREAQKQRCTDIFYNQQPKLDEAINKLEYKGSYGYEAMNNIGNIEETVDKNTIDINELQSYLRILNGFSDLFLTNIFEGTEYQGYFLTEFERVSIAKLFCGNYEINKMKMFNDLIFEKYAEQLKLKKDKLKSINKNLKKFEEICSYNDLD